MAEKISLFAITRTLIWCALVSSLAMVALADGTYQQTKDGKTLVWNQDPQPGDLPTWSGDRDRDGYASGFGTLTWYTASEKLYARYFGNMVHGKLSGPVNGHSKGTTGHAYFVDGKRVSPWAAGPVPSWTMSRPTPESLTEQVAPTIVENAQPAEPTPPEFNPPPPSYDVARARPEPNLEGLDQRSDGFDVPAEGPDVATRERSVRPTPKPKIEIDDSLRSLTGRQGVLQAVPPSSSRNNRTRSRTSSFPSNAPHLTKSEALQLADVEARRRGFDLNKYQRPEPQFDKVDHIWSLSYHEKQPDGAASGKYFFVAIDDQTKRTAVLPGR